MANFFNFYGNYIKAKEYYLLEEVNDKLCVENFDLKEEIEINLSFYRDIFAAQNILRQGIAELGSDSRTPRQLPRRSHVSHPRISSLQG